MYKRQLPFLIKEGELPFANGDYLFFPQIRKAVNEIKGEIGGMAVEIAGKVIEREISEEDHAKLIDEFIENVGEALSLIHIFADLIQGFW